jgi:hypothetical protein
MFEAIRSFLAKLLFRMCKKPFMKARIINIQEEVTQHSEYDDTRAELGL